MDLFLFGYLMRLIDKIDDLLFDGFDTTVVSHARRSGEVGGFLVVSGQTEVEIVEKSTIPVPMRWSTRL